MKNALFTIIMLMATQLTGFAQTSQDLTKINEAVRAFSSAGDRHDVASLEQILHPQFRAVVNRAFGSSEVQLMDKTLYLQLMHDKKIGGDTREVYLLQVDVVNNIATVKALFQGKALRFNTYISLVKLENGDWQIVGDLPDIAKV